MYNSEEIFKYQDSLEDGCHEYAFYKAFKSILKCDFEMELQYRFNENSRYDKPEGYQALGLATTTSGEEHWLYMNSYDPESDPRDWGLFIEFSFQEPKEEYIKELWEATATRYAEYIVINKSLYGKLLLITNRSNKQN